MKSGLNKSQEVKVCQFFTYYYLLFDEVFLKRNGSLFARCC